MSKKLKTGDVFYLELRDKKKYIFGRVLFDVNKQYHKTAGTSQIQDDGMSYLVMTHDGCQLIEIYEGIYDTIAFTESKVLIPRVFVKNIDGKFNALNWGIVGNQKVDYTQIEFPEHLNLNSGALYLDRGELSIKTKIDPGEEPGFKTSVMVPITIADAALYLQNKKELIPKEDRWPSYLVEDDLLYNPDLRRKIYKDIKLDPEKSYYELSKKMGFDLARFYK
jgi:hypothetical protein